MTSDTPRGMSYQQFRITVSGPFKDALVQKLAHVGSLGLIENDDHLVAYFPDAVPVVTIIRELHIMKAVLEASGHELTFEHALIPDRDWNESWKKGFTPLDVGERFTILPPWERTKPGRINLIIDPGMAFGTGHHETTRSCLVLMERHAGRTALGRFLDLGTGTGLLAIAAAKIGYASVLAIDTDPLTVDAAKKNCALNSAADVDVREGDLSVVDGTFDMITANLFSVLLIELAPAIASRLNRGGIAVLSGMLREQADAVLTAMNKAGLRSLEKLDDGKWTSLAVKLK